MSERRFNTVHLFLIAVAAGGIVAAAGVFSSKSSPKPIAAAPEIANGAPSPLGLPGPNHGAVAPNAPAGTVLEGEVLEVLDVPGYTYVRLGEKNTDGTWAAVSTTKAVVGQRRRVRADIQMKDFSSPKLGRTFPSIWFGAVDDGSGGAAAAPMGAGPNPHANLADPAKAAASVEIKSVERAPGPNGRTVAEIFAQRSDLSGKTVRVRGVVVKMNAGILGKTYLHLRDGSGDAGKGNNDLTVTTQSTPAVGDTVLLEGTLGLDRDIGSGYNFPTILEEAMSVTP